MLLPSEHTAQQPMGTGEGRKQAGGEPGWGGGWNAGSRGRVQSPTDVLKTGNHTGPTQWAGLGSLAMAEASLGLS